MPIPITLERILYRSGDCRVGSFRCPTANPDFATAGAIEGYTVFFPRSAVWIERDDAPPFVADLRTVTVYNQGQPYRRRRLSPEGDRGEWFSVNREMAVAIARGAAPEVDPDRPFRVAAAPSSPPLYYRQRRLVARIEAGRADGFEVDQEVTELIGAVLEAAEPARGSRRRPRTEAAHRDLVERAKAELARDPLAAPGVRVLAARLEVSPFHLCRVFRRGTGTTLHRYLLDLKTRLALEACERPGPDLSRIAHTLGFSSHSHFTLTMRARLGTTPSRIRNTLGRPGRAGGDR